MMEFLKKNYQKIIEFVLLFVPLIILFDFLTGLPLGRTPYGYFSDVADMLAVFMPFVLWKVFSAYWLK
jgi:hypothetical protein